jgi:hypothetical protein
MRRDMQEAALVHGATKDALPGAVKLEITDLTCRNHPFDMDGKGSQERTKKGNSKERS